VKWTKCCKGRAACPHINLSGETLRIKDDGGTVAMMPILSFRRQADSSKGNDFVTIRGKGGKVVHLSGEQLASVTDEVNSQAG
jgi:hypothetical protein